MGRLACARASLAAPTRGRVPSTKVAAVQGSVTARSESLATDFTYLKVVGRGWYYLSICALTTTMQAIDMVATLDLARVHADVDQVHVLHRPRLLSNNGSCHVRRDRGVAFSEGLKQAMMEPERAQKVLGPRYEVSMKGGPCTFSSV